MPAASRVRTERVFFANSVAPSALFFLALLFEDPSATRLLVILILLALLIAILLFLAIAIASLLLFLRLAILFDLPLDESLRLRILRALIAPNILARAFLLLANIAQSLRIGRLEIARHILGNARRRILKKTIDVRLLRVVALLGLAIAGSMTEAGEQSAIRHRGALDEPAEPLGILRRATLKRFLRDFDVFTLRALPDIDPELSEQRREPSWDSGLHRVVSG